MTQASHQMRVADQSRLNVEALLNDPTVSYPVKRVLRDWVRRDPIDAANDARVLCAVFEAESDRLLGSASWPSD